MTETIRIAGASGYWGDAAMATAQLLRARPDVIVYDYLAEITLGLMARMRANDPAAGYAPDFISAAMAPNLRGIADQGVQILSNAGGMNPEACADALRAEITKQGLPLTVATVAGDDLMDTLDDIAGHAPPEMFSGAPFPPPDKVRAINAYLGAFPIAEALATGADIVVTGRCVDSAVTLGAAIHAFGWGPQDLDRLAAGALAGHLIECGAQATGGNFTDWRDAGPADAVGYPFVDLGEDGSFTLSKPDGTGGVVSPASVGEQMLYEIGDPQAYVLPDVICDFSQVTIADAGPDRVHVTGARGRGMPDSYKCSLIFEDGWRAGQMVGFYGLEAAAKARSFAEAVLRRTRAGLRARNAPDFREVSVEVLGAGGQMGAEDATARDVVLKLAARHDDPRALGAMMKDLAGLALAGPPGISGFAGGRAKPAPVMALHSFLTPKDAVRVAVTAPDGARHGHSPPPPIACADATRPPLPARPTGPMQDVPLIALAWARSGDKGDAANIGVIPRKPEWLPAIWHALDEAHLRRTFAHVLDPASEIQRYLLPGTASLNILMTRALGGGGLASLRNDPQGKGFAQVLLASSVSVPQAIAKEV